MTDWTARAKAEILQTGQAPTDKTDKTRLSSVSSVPAGAVYETSPRVSSVSSVGSEAVSKNRALTSALIKAAMLACDFYGDGDAAREQMRADCVNTPAHLQADLLAHFKGYAS